MNTIQRICLALGLASLALHVSAQPGPPAKFGPKWRVLSGEWKAESPAGGSGACGFHFDLGEHVIVRTNHAILATSGGKPAAPHDDLMIIYPVAAEDKGKAMYFDNEGHVIDYEAEWTSDGTTLTFVSKPGPGPRFRLIYKRVDPNTLTVTFEFGAPGQTTFNPYTSGTIKRTS